MRTSHLYSVINPPEKKEEIRQGPMTKAPAPAEMSKLTNTNNATKMFGYRAFADRLRAVSLSKYGHSAGTVNRLTGLRAQPSHSSQQPCNQKDTHLINCKYTSLDRQQTNRHPSGEVIKTDTFTV